MGGPPPTAWALKVLDELADRQWHLLEEVLAAAAATVPPGIAYRRGETNRINCGGPGQRTRGDAATAIATGARNKAYEAVQVRVKTGVIDRKVSRNGVIRIRLNRAAMRARRAA